MRLAIWSCLLGSAFSPTAIASDDNGDLTTSNYEVSQSLQSAQAYGLQQSIAGNDCPLIANTGGPTANCSNYQDRNSSDIGYYFGYKAMGDGGKALEVDFSDQASGTQGGWATNPLNTFFPGSGDGSVQQLILDNENPSSQQEYDGLVVEGSGPSNDLAAISANGVGTIWQRGYWIQNGVSTDGVLDTSNTWVGLQFGASHDTGLTVDAGSTFSEGLIVLPSNFAKAGTNSEISWTQENGSTAGSWSIGPSRADNSQCGFCIQTPSSPWGQMGEVDALPTGGLILTGPVVFGSSHGTGSAVVEQALTGRGVGQIALTPDGDQESASDNLDAITPGVLTSDGTTAGAPVVFAKTLSMVVACSGGTSVPVVWKVDAIVAHTPAAIVSQSAVRLVGTSAGPTITVALDANGNLAPVANASSTTTCVASAHTVNNLDNM